jgi:UDP-N-acetylmuramoylalanine--D-glutamate ligase
MATAQQASTLIVGLGKTGLACARFLQAQHISYAVTDSRDVPPGLWELKSLNPSVTLTLAGFKEAALEGIQQLVVSPGVSLQETFIQSAIARGIEVIGDIELFARHADAPVLAITGSNGKSTVTTLVGHMTDHAGLTVQVGGNLGTPALDLLLKSRSAEHKTDYYILELSSFQLEATYSLNARAAVVLNVSPDHMDRYANVAEYAAAKQRVYHGDGIMVINKDDSAVLAMSQKLQAEDPARKVFAFTLKQPGADEFGILQQQGQDWLAHGNQRLLPVNELRIAGRHNVANALAALALGYAIELPMPAMLEALRVAEIGGVNWYNDSKATNVGATVSAIEGMPGPKLLIAGGEGKDADFSPLREAVHNNKVHSVILIGRDADLLAKAIGDAATIKRADSLEKAVRQAHKLAHVGDSVLLSPACASFDMFHNYEHRGEVFATAVETLAQEVQS